MVERYKAPRSQSQQRRFARMSPEERVNFALELSDSIMNITLESIKNRHPHISDQRLIELARERFQKARRARQLQGTSQRHREDIVRILSNTRVNMSRIVMGARRDGTLDLFRELLSQARPAK